MKKKIINLVLRIVSPFYKNRRYEVYSEKTMANLGCGLLCLPRGKNIDGSFTAFFDLRRFSFLNKILYKPAGSSIFYSFKEYNEIIKNSRLLFFDLRNGAPFPNNSLDVIFSSYFLKHLNKNDGRKFLKDCYRTVKEGGMMRLMIPDLDIAFRMYQNDQVEEMEDPFFYNSDGQDFHSHKYNYNFTTLQKILSSCGFKNVYKEKYKEGRCPDIKFLDIYPEHSSVY